MKERPNTLKSPANPREAVRQIVTMDVYNFEHVPTFKYLGAVITADNNMQEEIKQRITQANKCKFAVQTLLKSTTYASETWISTDSSRNRAPKKV